MIEKILNSDAFNDLIKSNKKIVCKYTAHWCGPCKEIGPYYHELSKEFSDVVCIEIDVTKADDELTSDISSIPTFKFFKSGKEVKNLAVIGSRRDLLRLSFDSL
jgi:thioredoxin 1